jgi:hypothetical protein
MTVVSSYALLVYHADTEIFREFEVLCALRVQILILYREDRGVMCLRNIGPHSCNGPEGVSAV